MAEEPIGFTVYLEGHEGHRGNVLAHAFIAKVQRLVIVLARLERAFNGEGNKRTDFEITAATKTNPTTLTLKPVPKSPAYNPAPAFKWGMRQIVLVSRGEMPDGRVRSEIAADLVKLATKETDDAYKDFWMNGHAESVKFNKDFLVHAERIARVRAREDAPSKWHTGVSRGSIVGELKKVDDLDGSHEFVVVPRTGPDTVTCKFPDSLRAEIGKYLFKIVRVTGKLHYGEMSPFPILVDVEDHGLEHYLALFDGEKYGEIELSTNIMLRSREIRDFYYEQADEAGLGGKMMDLGDAIHLAAASIYGVDEFHTRDNDRKGRKIPLLDLYKISGNPKLCGKYDLKILSPEADQTVLDLDGKANGNGEDD